MVAQHLQCFSVPQVSGTKGTGVSEKEPDPREGLSRKQRRLLDLGAWLVVLGFVLYLVTGFVYAFVGPGFWLWLAVIVASLPLPGILLVGWTLRRTGRPFEGLRWWWPFTKRWGH